MKTYLFDQSELLEKLYYLFGGAEIKLRRQCLHPMLLEIKSLRLPSITRVDLRGRASQACSSVAHNYSRTLRTDT